MAESVFLFTLEVVGKCPEPEAEYWLKVAAHALEQAGFVMDDAMAIGITGAKGAAIDYPDPVVPSLNGTVAAVATDTRRMSSAPGQM